MLLFQPPCSEAYNPRLSFRSKSKEQLNERRAGLSNEEEGEKVEEEEDIKEEEDEDSDSGTDEDSSSSSKGEEDSSEDEDLSEEEDKKGRSV